MEDAHRQTSQKDGTSFSLEDGKKLLEFLVEKGLDKDTLIQRYDEKCEEYNKMQTVRGYKAPTAIADTLASLYPSNRENVQILDAAAGTGLVSVEVRKRGFVHVDGLDPSEGMLEEAKKSNLYERYICDFLGDNTLDIADDTYTVLTLVSLTSEILKKLSIKCYEELVRITKSGGHILINHYDYIFDSDDIKGNLAHLESRGMWKLVDKQYVVEKQNGVRRCTCVYKVA
ncbi:methyltransferase-like protein 27 [Haliotis rufescens]|uniref:methyltransferase-like protein 27 n=1 Tax=Haliotis rufescens TaxID=6454 RepID=UPI00201F2494|nr:methyltransferase-like protein 27 [Haliotis rufescens]